MSQTNKPTRPKRRTWKFAATHLLFLLFLFVALTPLQSKATPNCDSAGIQTQLNGGVTPLAIYNACGPSSLANLYGLNYQGGLLAYLNTSDGTGLIAAPSDYNADAFWTNMSLGHYVTTGASGSAIGTGKANTATILSTLGAPTTQPSYVYNYAAYVSKTTINGYSDWFLPSQNEMIQVLNNVITTQGCLNTISQRGAHGGYWTSTESNFNYAFYIDCNGNAHRDTKNDNWSVRLVRAFPTVVPVINSFSPAVVGIGNSLTITGSNFSATASANSVIFTGGAIATPTAATTTSLTVTIPVGAQSGPISVTVNGIPSAASASTLTIQGIPTIGSFSPTTVQTGNVITITGTNYSTNAGANTVIFAGGVTATASSATATSVTVTVPAGATSGPIKVSSNGMLSAASQIPLTIATPPSGVIVNSNNGTLSCLGIIGQAAAGAVVTTVTCNSNAPVWQQLPDGRIQYGTGIESQSYCLDADTGHPANWNKAQIWNCTGIPQNQNWAWNGVNTIQLKYNSLCLAPNTPGQQLQLVGCNQQTQSWAFAATPSAPTITNVVVDFTEATVGFTPPVRDGGMPITQYIVTANGVQAKGTSSPIYVSGLTNDVNTTFTIVATNARGTGHVSQGFNSAMQSNCYGSPRIPGCPPHFAAQITGVTPGNQQVAVAFTPVNPLYSGGSPIVSYSVCASPNPPDKWYPTYCGGPGDVSATGTASPIVVTGLTNGTAYTVTVTATNADKWGTTSPPSQSVTPTASSAYEK